jgi:competence protein ComEA
MLDRIAQAERRANSAEERAREAVEKISEPLPPIETESIFAEPEPASAAMPSEPVPVNSATLGDLRAIGLSHTQAARLLAHRERAGGFGSLDELDELPGFPDGFLAELKTRVRL